MPEYHCQLCDYTTIKKSSYDNHLKSSKHKAKCSGNNDDDCSTISNHSTQYSSQSKIKEMEYEFKIKEMEYQLKIKELESQLQIQNLQIQNLNYQLLNSKQVQQVQQVQQITQSNPIQLSITEKRDKKESVLDMLNKRKSMTINYFMEQCLDDVDLNPSITLFRTKTNGDYIFPKYIGSKDYSKYIVVDVICKTLVNIPVNERPIYCSDVRRRQFYIKTENGWFKPTDDEINTIITKLFWKAYKIMSQAFKEISNYRLKNIQAIEKLYGINDDKAHENILCRAKELFPYKEEQELHFSKLKVKLSELTNNKVTNDKNYTIDEQDKSDENNTSDTDEYDAENDSM